MQELRGKRKGRSLRLEARERERGGVYSVACMLLVVSLLLLLKLERTAGVALTKKFYSDNKLSLVLILLPHPQSTITM